MVPPFLAAELRLGDTRGVKSRGKSLYERDENRILQVAKLLFFWATASGWSALNDIFLKKLQKKFGVSRKSATFALAIRGVAQPG